MGVYMRISDLQTKDVVNKNDGRNIGRIIDVDILESGMINFFVVEPKKILKKLNIYNNETSIKLNQVVKIGEDVILVDLWFISYNLYGCWYMNKRIVIISIIVLLLDQITKLVVQMANTSVNIISNVLYFIFSKNTGASWSILEGKVTLLIVISIVMLVIVYSLMFSYPSNRYNDTSFGLLFGGILGNLIDRIFYGYVRDFIGINIFGYHFPIFNIADMSIVIGVILLVIATVKGDVKNGTFSRRRKFKNR